MRMAAFCALLYNKKVEAVLWTTPYRGGNRKTISNCELVVTPSKSVTVDVERVLDWLHYLSRTSIVKSVLVTDFVITLFGVNVKQVSNIFDVPPPFLVVRGDDSQMKSLPKVYSDIRDKYMKLLPKLDEGDVCGLNLDPDTDVGIQSRLF